MTKADLIERLRERTGLPKHELSQIVDALLHELIESFIRQERVEIRGFGVFIPVKRKRRGKDEMVPRIKFKISETVRARMISEEKAKGGENALRKKKETKKDKEA